MADVKEEQIKEKAVTKISKVQKFLGYLKLARETSLRPDYQSLARQVLEMMVVFICCRMGPGGYLMAEMGKKKYDWHYKLGFLNGRQYVRRINQINDKEYYPATFNKLIEKAILMNSSIPTPRMLGHLNAGRGRSCDGVNLRTAEDLLALLDRTNEEKLCFKLISSYGGAGFRAVKVLREEQGISLLDLLEQKVYSVSEYFEILDVAAKGDFLIEEYLEQHPDIKKFNPSSVNTLRILIYHPEGKEPRCLGAYLRIGREGAVIDNRSAGGIGGQVDLDTGALHAAVFTLSAEKSLIEHPDTGVLIKGQHVTGFHEAVDLACETVKVFPGINFAGVDVAIGVDGPVIIELNARADYVGFFTIKVPSRHALN